MDRQNHIIVVEHTAEVRDVIVMMLEDRGHGVRAAANGAALRDLLRTGEPVDAVILDCIMPGETGPELMDHLEQLGLPVVMISGHPDAIAFAEEHGLQILRKPFGTQKLSDALDKALSSGKLGRQDA